MKLLWLIDNYGFSGCSYGFATHRKNMQDALLAAGVELTHDPGDSYDLVVHPVFPHRFRPIPEKKNVLFTAAAEMSEPSTWRKRIERANVLVLTCEHSKRVCAEYYSGPIEVCPEGVDSALFQFYERRKPPPGERFRFLFVGNGLEDYRKGLFYVVSAWKRWKESGRRPKNARLYIKTTSARGFYSRTSLLNMDGMIWDGRDLPVKEIIDLYNSAHAFVFPSCGEGWGLTLTEAMATGLPCIWTHWSAMIDYADESIGYPITKFKMTPFWKPPREPGIGKPDCVGAAADEDAIIEAMKAIYRNYPEALKRGRRASERMHGSYTWTHAAEKFIKICERYV